MPETCKAQEAYAYPLLIKDLLHTPLANAPAQEIAYADHVRYDYATLKRRINRLAAMLTALGVDTGHTVAVMDWDSNRYFECFFAVPMLGAVLHTVNVRLAPEQILYTINHAEDDVILVHVDFLPIVEAIRDRIERQVQIVLLTDDDGVAPPSYCVGEYEDLMSRAGEEFAFEDFDEWTRATTFYTTGTTGDPKGVYYSHRQIVLHTLGEALGMASSSTNARFRRDDVYMPITPMFHVHAWGFPYVATLLGVKQVYPGRYAPDKLLQLIDREKVTVSHCVPAILHMLLNEPLARQIDLSNWRVFIGGSAMPRGLAKAALDLGIDVCSAYGMSETGPYLTCASLDPGVARADRERQLDYLCKTGRVAPLVEMRVVDTDMKDVPVDGATTGEVVVRAPWLTQGYLGDAERSDELWRGGYLHTGDVGYVDAEGYLKITDRMKDVIKSGGEWISSLELEDIASQHSAVSEVAAIGVPDPRWGERPMLLIVLKEGETATVEAIQQHIRRFVERGELSKWAMPDQVEFVDAIAKTSVGKIDKKALRAQYG